MHIGICANKECTVAQTGICMLGTSVEACPHHAPYVPEEDDLENRELLEPELSAPVEKPKFPPSAALGIEDVSARLAKRSGHIIGILGSPDSGKTACLVSLYLSLAHGQLAGFTFAGSESLLTFDEISRGARGWAGELPDQMTSHTEMKDNRTAGFLHLKLCRVEDEKVFDIYIPDLPGEWSTSLVEKNEHERLSFLKSANTIWLMIDGSGLNKIETCSAIIYKTKLLIARVAEMCKPEIPTIRLVVTRLDQGEPKPHLIEQIKSEAQRHNINLEVDSIASFSQSDSIEPSAGIADLLNNSLKAKPNNQVSADTVAHSFWPSNSALLHSSRQILKIIDEVNNG